MEVLLAIDLETTGLVDEDKPLTDPEQPVAVAISAILIDGDQQEVAALDLLVDPGEAFMQAGAERVHGITAARARQFGVPAKSALSVVGHLARRARVAISYGVFDRKVLESMYLRAGIDPTVCVTRPRLRWIDVMLLAEGPAGITREDGSTKWPKLGEAVERILHRPHENPHQADADARACLNVYQELCRRGLVPEEMK